MSGILQDILGWVLVYRYPALFVVCFLSSLGVPLPAAYSTIAAAAFGNQGYLNVGLVVLSGFAGNVMGDFTAYGLVRKYGRRILYWFRLGAVVESRILKQVERIEDTYSAAIITASRFQDQATTIVNIIAGLGNIRFRRFAWFAVVGDILQIVFYGSIGYFFAGNWQTFYGTIGVFSWVIILGTAVIMITASRRLARLILR